MKLFIWNCPTNTTIQAIAIANTEEEAREIVLSSIRFDEGMYGNVIKYINSHTPNIYHSPDGWVQEVGSQLT